MPTLSCDGCGSEQSRDEDHWIHVSVFHHNDPDYVGDWDRDHPDNFAATLCPDCADPVIKGAGGAA